ncbi:Metalloenzyme, LuxS/M16 peptidase-like protein [Umbelopsis sp. PMI_123]|nr:Metalloenzyme, LuxS/M16 peptidase-like protein [Umbelopsis sp. PMI_123]
MSPKNPTNGYASNFKEIRQIDTDYGIKITKFKSDKTGLTIVHADIDAPLVSGYFALATEALDDYGCPHTLEHLVFLGSEKYPYKGVLDSLANRALAQGTNAWTDVDHTCYTITTAGSEGFLNILPVYIDHILYPTLTSSGCYTEVHHINGKGEDAGVVYSEMQGRQNSSDDRMQLRMQRHLFPPGCGYRSETGGLMKELRDITVDQIRDYHKSYYRPDNLCLIITGKLDHAKLLKVLEPVEANILSKPTPPAMKRPWVESGPVPKIAKIVEEIVLFPDEDESMGEIIISWNGPDCHEYLELKAVDVLNTYLTDSPVSVLQKEFVEIEDPLCTDIDFHIVDQIRAVLSCNIANVPEEELEEFIPMFFDTLNRVIEEEGIDMDRMKTVILRDKLKLLNNIETNSHFSAAITCIGDFLYGKADGSDLEAACQDLKYLDELLQYTSDDWIRLLDKWYVKNPHIALMGKPSAEFADQLLKEESERISQQRARLGEKKLADLEEKLEECKKENEVPVPPEVVNDVPIPSVSSIDFIEVQTARTPDDRLFSNTVQDHVNNDLEVKLPFPIQFDHINSSFIKLSVYISTANVGSHLRPLTTLFLDALFTLPIETENGQIPYEEVVKRLSEDTVDYYASLGTSVGFREVAMLGIKVEVAKYEKAVQWVRDALWNTKFTPERLKITASKILNDIPQAKRDGRGMANSAMRELQFEREKSTNASSNVLYQAKYLPDLLQRLEKDPQSVLDDCEQFRQSLINSPAFTVHIIGNILKLPHPRSVFSIFEDTTPTGRPAKVQPYPWAREVLNNKGKAPGDIGVVVGLPSIESSFSLHSAAGPVSFESPDIAPLLVLNEVLETMEGIFWKLIRGQGLAYSCSLRADVEAHLVYFSIYRSPNAYKAFLQARNVIYQLKEKELDIEDSAVDGAKSGVIFSIVNREDTISHAAGQSFTNQILKQVKASYNRDLLAQVQSTTKDDLHRVLNKYLVALFEPEKSNVVVVSTPGKVNDIADGFKSIGFNVTTTSLDDLIV